MKTLKIVDGILLLDKPLNISSNAALQRAKRLYKAKKAGHTGSLDPLATGMLPICFGEATKFSQYLLDSNKSYDVNVRLGIKTTTGDAEGDVLSQQSAEHVDQSMIEKVLSSFLGTIQQIPPMFSALKYQGKPLYKFARAGIDIPRVPRTIQIFSLKLLQIMREEFCLHVTCSKGTYIRSLVEDIGDRLGCGATVTALRREYVDPYETFKMLTFEELEEIDLNKGEDGLINALLPVESPLYSLPSIQVSAIAEAKVNKGQVIFVDKKELSGNVRLISEDNRFLGIGEILPDGCLKPKRLISVA